MPITMFHQRQIGQTAMLISELLNVLPLLPMTSDDSAGQQVALDVTLDGEAQKVRNSETTARHVARGWKIYLKKDGTARLR